VGEPILGAPALTGPRTGGGLLPQTCTTDNETLEHTVLMVSVVSRVVVAT
jgi:hypothetical protein